MLRSMLLISLLTLNLSAQLIVEITPIKMKAKRVVASDVTEVDTWTVRVCSMADHRVRLDMEWVFIASPAPIEFIGTETGKLLVRGKRKWKPLALAGKGLSAGATIGVGLIAMETISASAGVGAALVVGAPLMKRLGEWADEQSKAQEIDLTRVLPAELDLDAQQCVTGLTFTNVVPEAHSKKYKYEADPMQVKYGLTVLGGPGNFRQSPEERMRSDDR
ncbi:MAG: hypothetical protein GY906_22405 [bacterium]|nr:hypothetical protein [bacterium]